ncbi:MAG: hypothetical protein WCO71_01195 [Pseudomonadota bacterium]
MSFFKDIISTLVFALMITLSACGSPRKEHTSKLKYFGADNKPVTLTFETFLWFQIPDDFQGTPEDLLTSAYREKIDSQINLQDEHMFGVFSMQDDFVKNPGVIENSPDIKVLSASEVPGQPYVKITYSYSDRAVFHKDVFRKFGNDISFWLPKEVTGFYAKGIPPGKRKNLCTDAYYNDEEDFWYFWNPRLEGCPLKNKDMVRVQAHFTPVEETTSTYPDYARLYGTGGDRKTVKAAIVFGIDENFHSGDLGRVSYAGFTKNLLVHGYQRTLREPLREVFTHPGADFDAEISVYLENPETKRFDETVFEALETADIFLYDGHSGLGGHLEPARFEEFLGRKLELPKDKYQIYIFQGCSTYAYYNESYFKLKKSDADPSGTKNLDIVTAGIELLFENGADQDFAIIDGLVGATRPSWQKIITDIYAVAPESTALHQVNGDEDNPTHN